MGFCSALSNKQSVGFFPMSGHAHKIFPLLKALKAVAGQFNYAILMVHTCKCNHS